MGSLRVLVCMPTYNERDNLPAIVERLHKRYPRQIFSSSTTAARTARAR